MTDGEWLPETEPPKKAPVATIDRGPLSERSKLSDRGLVDFRRVCDQMGILDPETDTIRVSRLTPSLNTSPYSTSGKRL
jgi:hypothetical protein